ncbi:hypothetical protein F5884DRAFT_811279 [Xylogone sp. PMI_703]|nr:hypothetical protein F5884DRAFT_811279 [Xylogone sp. PMI_703]
MCTPETSTSQLPSQFHRFGQLPFELRRCIWKLCCPHRIIDLDRTPSPLELSLKISCQTAETSIRNRRLPVVTRICRESRAVFFERDPGFNQEKLNKLLEPTSEGFDYFFKDMNGFNPSTDVVHLNVRIYVPFSKALVSSFPGT